MAHYAAPGPPEDPWGPYIREAAGRFAVPERWIRAVMRQESGGHEYLGGQPVTSDAGAAGLMQLMPATYAELRARYNLGADIYDPHDNIMAGTAYISELYAQYGSPAFLAAYDAGPHRLDEYMSGRGALPNETVNYLAAVAPSLGNDRPMSGPLAAYADNGGAQLRPDPVPRAYAPPGVAACWRDPNAAYDPDAPCRPPPPVQVAAAMPPLAPAPAFSTRPGSVLWGQGVGVGQAVQPAACWHDPDAAYDPEAPCRPPPQAMQPQAMQAQAMQPQEMQPQEVPPQEVPPQEVHRQPSQPPPATQIARAAPQAAPHVSRLAANFLIPSAAAATIRPAMATGRWAIQVGAFSSPDQARRVAESARLLAPRELGAARTQLGSTSPFGGVVLYRARLLGLSAESAAAACSALSARRHACVTVPPGG